MKKLLVVAATVVAVFALAVPAFADPTNAPDAVFITGSCTGLGDVTVVAILQSHGVAFQVVGTSTVLLLPGNPGLATLAAAAGTTCTVTSPVPGEVIPVVIVNS